MKYCRAVTLFCLLGMASGTHAETLGRLFYSPAERESLTMPSPTANALPPKINLQIDGIIQRSDGNQMVWRNGQLHHQKSKNKSASNLTLPTPKHTITFQLTPHLPVPPP
jgi:hypothetical protein